MKRRIFVFALAWTISLFVFLGSFSNHNPVAAQTKNYYFPQVRIEIHIERNGSFIYDEYRTYDFLGSFSWASIWVPLRVDRKGYQYDVIIEDFKILDEKDFPLRTETQRSGGKLEAKLYYRANDQIRTFHTHYRVKGGIFSYPDVSELYWQVIGDDWDKPTQHATINVHLPEAVANKSDILVYGHGPLSGNSEIVSTRSARFTVENLGSFQPVEVRMVWPAGIVNGVPSNRYSRESIKDEEAGVVQKTIREVQRAHETAIQDRAKRMRFFYAWIVWMLVGPLIWLPFYIRSWKKVGKDYLFGNIPEYFRELPSNLPPALVEILLREGQPVTPASFTATLFDMARRGYLEMDDWLVERKRLFGKKEEYETTVACRKNFLNDSELLPYEKDLLKLLFVAVAKQAPAKGAKLELKDLKNYFEKKPQAFQKWYRAWMKKIEAESKKQQFIEPASIKTRNTYLAVTIPAAVLTLNIVLVVLGFILIPKIKRRARDWARENELWRALERFLDDFSDFKDIPPEAYKLWEHYLVFGIIFGNAKKILKMLPILLKDERAVAPIWYYGFQRAAFISTGRMESMIKSIESMSTSIQHGSMSAAHYSSGGGGGFSRGGGGGGGGGGGRAG